MAVFTKNLKKHIFVHPGDRLKLQSAIKIALLKDRKKYSDSLEGALLDVNKIQVIGDRHLIVNGYLSMEVIANFEVFAPTVGMTLEGVINKVHYGHYGCLVLDTFNASLSRSGSLDVMPTEGDSCTFVVTKLVVDGDILFMKGQLISVTPATNHLTDVKSDLETVPMVTNNYNALNIDKPIKMEPVDNSFPKSDKTSMKKHKKNKSEEPITDEIGGSVCKFEPEDGLISESDKRLKKKHKKKSKEDSLEFGDDNVTCDIRVKIEPVESPKDKLRNKHKKKSKEDKVENCDKTQKMHGKRQRLEAEDVQQEIGNCSKFETKPRLGIDLPLYNSPSKQNHTALSQIKIKSEPVSPVKKSKFKDR